MIKLTKLCIFNNQTLEAYEKKTFKNSAKYEKKTFKNSAKYEKITILSLGQSYIVAFFFGKIVYIR